MDKNITWSQGRRAAWAIEKMTRDLLLTQGLSFPGMTGSELRGDVASWPVPHCSEIRPVGWAGRFQGSLRGLGQSVCATKTQMTCLERASFDSNKAP